MKCYMPAPCTKAALSPFEGRKPGCGLLEWYEASLPARRLDKALTTEVIDAKCLPFLQRERSGVLQPIREGRIVHLNPSPRECLYLLVVSPCPL